MRRVNVVTALAAYGGLLVVLRPHWADVAGWTHWSADPERALVDAAALAGWAIAAWLFVVTALVVVSQGHSASGRWAAGAARMITPRAARRMLEAALGVALAVGPAGAALAGPAAPPVQVSTQLAPGQVPAPLVAAAEAAFPDLDRPLTTGSTPTAIPAANGPTATVPASPPAPAGPAAPSPPTASSPVAGHTVVPGDTLWDLAAAASAPDASPTVITALWQQWYASNRAVIGTDPSLLLPGELLSLPGSS
jgi:nucleoid-associated protein YgaU